ncbi:MAG: hypothetical protein Q4D88_04505 [Anaerococcus sp.]|nr:hypothetical protein [Anaerococcus sp.]
MRLELIKDKNKLGFDFKDTKDLSQSLNKDFDHDYLNLYIKNDRDNKNLSLLVILSPILISSFDSSLDELSFFKKTMEESNFTYGLYPYFFPFDKEKYFNFYKNHKKKEDISLEDSYIRFKLNPLDYPYILSLVYLIEKLMEKKRRDKLLDYFAEIRNDIVINGRRSILANGIRAFYLSKYVCVWMLILIKKIEDEPLARDFLSPIYEKINNLQRPLFGQEKRL